MLRVWVGRDVCSGGWPPRRALEPYVAESVGILDLARRRRLISLVWFVSAQRQRPHVRRAAGSVGGARGFGSGRGIPGSGLARPTRGQALFFPYKARGARWGNAVCRSWRIASPCLLSSPVSPSSSRFRATGKGTENGFQLRGHHGGGGDLPRPRPPQQQHHADRLGRVAQDDAEEVARVSFGAVRRRPRPQPRASLQVRLRPGHPPRLIQVPAPPHQLPGPEPLFPDRGRRRGAVLVLPHRRGAVTHPSPESTESRTREGIHSIYHVIRKGVYLFLP